MKPRTIACFAALMLFTISCKKENNPIQTSPVTNESSIQALSSDASESVGTHAVKIGNQIWRTKNLNVVRYRNGDLIPQVKNSAKWASLTTGAWCWYNNDSANGCIYGRLYNWYAVNDPRGLAPEGWHIPSDAEWITLSTSLGGGVVAGGKMKSTGTIEAGTGLWYAPNTGATNSSGFTGLPGGYRTDNGTFSLIGYHGYWWSSTETDYSEAYAWTRSLYYDIGGVDSNGRDKQNGQSVRCVKD